MHFPDQQIAAPQNPLDFNAEPSAFQFTDHNRQIVGAIILRFCKLQQVDQFEQRQKPVVQQNRALVRCFLGGARDEEILQSSEKDILRIVCEELRQMIAIDAEPLFARVYKWKSAMAQYSVGHLERLQRVAAHSERLTGLALAGNGYSGIGVPDCIRSGADAASKILTEMGMWSAA